MARNDNIIPMNFDSQFYKKLANQKFHQQEYKKAADYYSKVLEMSPQDFETKVIYSECLVHLGLGSKAEHLFYESIAQGEATEESYFQLSQLNIIMNEANKAFLFGMNYVTLSEDESYQEELEDMFEVSYHSAEKIEIECQLFAIQLIFQYMFSQGRLPEARDFILSQNTDIQDHRVVRNLLAMCYLYLNEYETAKEMFERLLSEDNTDVHALCHYTLLLYNTNNSEKYQRYLKILSKVMPMNDDESFKLGIVLCYLKQYEASQKILQPLYRKGKFLSIQMYNALSYNHYYLGNLEDSKYFWDKLQEVSKVEVGHAPWVIDESKAYFDQQILPLLLNDDSHHRLYGIFLLNQLKGREVLLTQEIWGVLESMNDYEKLYLTYLIQDLKLNKLDFIHKGMLMIYGVESLKNNEELFIVWIDQAEAIIEEKVELTQVSDYVAACVYMYYRNTDIKITKQQVIEWFDISAYRLNKTIDLLVSI
ncbi:tetratricopeptide repeat protein [Staphylococcus caeli]|uniref:tetratricopeptide repeat protein n=1 Tax=Staphylococcus caeli TaxID=2201815 RepID=UPI003F54DF8B